VLNILFLCWRDIRNPRAGGAEVFIHEVGKRLVEEGHEVTLFAADFDHARPEETIDGVRIVRRGAQATVHWRFYKWWRSEGQRRGYDLVVDVVNTIPFFTPLFIRGGSPRRVALFFQLCRQIWWYESKFPFNVVGYLLEPLYVRIYRRTRVITISESSKKDLRRNGISSKLVDICPIGTDVKPLDDLEPKSPGLNVIFVGRLTASKRPDHVMRAFAELHRQRADARLWIVGDGRPRYEQNLKMLLHELRLEGCVEFKGHVSDEEKLQLMRDAHVIAVTSVKEGWGLIVTEAAALGTPAVVYDIDGLRDSVRSGETGVVCRRNTPEELAARVLDLVRDQELYERLRHNGLVWSREFTWERTAEVFKKLAGISQARTPD
jgi:glycosyltransferase involved in cell wall biosynthesis